jgi:hypothetical protein
MHIQAVEIDLAHGKRKWQESEAFEIEHLAECKHFIDKLQGGTAPIGYKKIWYHMFYEVKHDD